MRALLALIACMAATSVSAAPKPEDIAAYRALVDQDLRLAAVGYRLARANAPFCDSQVRNPGWVLHDVRQYPDVALARAAFVFRQPVSISALVPGGPAEQAGLAIGDGPFAIGGDTPIGYGSEPVRNAASIDRLETVKKALSAALKLNPPLPLIMTTGAGNQPFVLNPPPICASDFWVDTKKGRDAGADGDAVRITSDMMAFIANDDALAALVAHELSHNILQHQRRLRAAKATKGAARKIRLRARDTEIEADRLSVWLMANAGFDPSAAVRFWQRYGPSYGSELFMGGAHLRWKKRVQLLETEIAQISQATKTDGLFTPPLLVEVTN